MFSATPATLKLVLNCKTIELSLEVTKALHITYFLGYISTINYQNRLMNNKVIAKIKMV